MLNVTSNMGVMHQAKYWSNKFCSLASSDSQILVPKKIVITESIDKLSKAIIMPNNAK